MQAKAVLAVLSVSVFVAPAEGWFWRKDRCPAVSTVEDFDLEEYTRASWYVQKQQVTGYQSLDQLYCVVATYSLDTKKRVPFFKGKVVEVRNYANNGGVNGEASPPSSLCARAVGDVASKLSVAPCFLTNFFAGDYWVVAVGRGSNGQYQWAIVSGGQPKEKYADGCTTKRTGINGSGFWYFTRERIASPETLAEMDTVAKQKGFTLDFLNPVVQQGCRYQGAVIKDGI